MGYHISKQAEAARRRAYQVCATDLEAARRCGISPAAFAGWRRLRGLKGLAPAGQPARLTPVEEARRRHAYESCSTEGEAAALCGVRKDAFRLWRITRGLKPRARPGRPPLDVASEKERLEAYGACPTDGKSAKMCGMNRGAFAEWRRSRGLLARRPDGA